MKLMWILCLCFISLHQLVHCEDETSTLDTTLPSTQSTVSPSSAPTEAPEKPDVVSSIDSSTVSSVPAIETTAATSEATSTSTEVSEASTRGAAPAVNSTAVIYKLSDQIRKVLEHFQEANAVGLPGQNILPDPLSAPDVSDGGLLGSSEFYNITVHGLSNFTVDSVNLLLDQMTVYVKICIKDVFIFGNTTQSSGYFFTTKGPFNLTLTNVTAEGVVYLVVEADGSLRANRTVTTIKYDRASFHIGEKNSAPLSQVVDAVGLTALHLILPFIQARMDERLTTEVNSQLKDSPKFLAIRDKSPVDLAIMKGREYVAKKYDPYVVKNVINFESDVMSLQVGPVSLRGLSNFARVGDVSFGMANRTMIFKLHMITGRVHGEGEFYFNLGKVPQVPGRRGKANFSVDHLQFEAVVHQPLNLKEKPRLQDLQLEVGGIKVQLDKRGNFDYLIELVVGHLPDFLRYYLIDILEEPIKRRIQKDILDEVDVDQVVTSNLSLFEKLLLENMV